MKNDNESLHLIQGFIIQLGIMVFFGALMALLSILAGAVTIEKWLILWHLFQ